MARLPRYVMPGQPHHIIQRGNNGQIIFAADADYQFFRDALVDASRKHGLQIHAYVWMTNHIHLLATPQFENSISTVFQSVGRKYVQYFNYTYQRSGTLWEGRYRATGPENGVRHDYSPSSVCPHLSTWRAAAPELRSVP
jgi:putative transposase